MYGGSDCLQKRIECPCGILRQAVEGLLRVQVYYRAGGAGHTGGNQALYTSTVGKIIKKCDGSQDPTLIGVITSIEQEAGGMGLAIAIAGFLLFLSI